MEEKQRVNKIIEALAEKKAFDVIRIEVGSLTTLTDDFILCTGTSARHMNTLMDAVLESLHAVNERALRVEGKAESGWILIDYGDVVLNIFDTQTRKLYDLERLWADGDIQRFEQRILHNNEERSE